MYIKWLRELGKYLGLGEMQVYTKYNDFKYYRDIEKGTYDEKRYKGKIDPETAKRNRHRVLSGQKLL